MYVSLSSPLLTRSASSKTPSGWGRLFFRNLLRSRSLCIGGLGGRLARLFPAEERETVGRRLVVEFE